MMLISEAIEIDLRDCMKHGLWREDNKVRSYAPIPPIYLPITYTNQKYGVRTWFVCPYCKRRVSKLYAVSRHIACRHCLDLRYDSQYKKDPRSQYAIKEQKLLKYDSQKRLLWYDDRLTQFGRRYFRHSDAMKLLESKIEAQNQREMDKVNASIANLQILLAKDLV